MVQLIFLTLGSFAFFIQANKPNKRVSFHTNNSRWLETHFDLSAALHQVSGGTSKKNNAVKIELFH